MQCPACSATCRSTACRRIRIFHQAASQPATVDLRVDGMPPHSNGAERAVRSVAKRCTDARVHLKSVRGTYVGSKKTTITTSALNRAMAARRAVTYAPADPGWSILGGPPNKPALRMPPGGAGGGSGGRRRPAAGERGGAGTAASLPPAGPERRDDGRLRPAAAGRGLRAPALYHLPRDAALIVRIGSRRRPGWPSAPGTQDLVPRRSPRAPPEGY